MYAILKILMSQFTLILKQAVLNYDNGKPKYVLYDIVISIFKFVVHIQSGQYRYLFKVRRPRCVCASQSPWFGPRPVARADIISWQEHCLACLRRNLSSLNQLLDARTLASMRDSKYSSLSVVYKRVTSDVIKWLMDNVSHSPLRVSRTAVPL